MNIAPALRSRSTMMLSVGGSGRKEVAAHGTRDMPIWGNRYGPNVAQTFLVPGFDPKTMIRMRILEVMDYLNRIQKK